MTLEPLFWSHDADTGATILDAVVVESPRRVDDHPDLHRGTPVSLRIGAESVGRHGSVAETLDAWVSGSEVVHIQLVRPGSDNSLVIFSDSLSLRLSCEP